MRVLICGDRNWEDVRAIEEFISKLPKDTIIIHGLCRGADIIADDMAHKHGLKILKFPAEWHKYGKAAGPIRNKKMIVDGKPDEVVAFHNNLSKSRGTVNMIKQARIYGIPCKIVKSD